MVLKLGSIWPGQAKKAGEDPSSGLQDHVDADFIADTINSVTNATRDKAALSPEVKKQLDYIARIIALINEQQGVRANLRSIEFPLNNDSKLIVIHVDIAAKGLNRKIKAMTFWADFSEDKPKVAVNGFKLSLGGGHYIESERASFSPGLDINIPQDRADFLKYIGLYIAGKMQQQRFQDRAKGYIHQQVAMEERLANVKPAARAK